MQIIYYYYFIININWDCVILHLLTLSFIYSLIPPIHLLIHSDEYSDIFYLFQQINIGTHADNINLDHDTGVFWVAAVPKGLDFVKYTKNLQHPAPSQVLTLKLNTEKQGHSIPFPDYELREVYLNDGREHRGSTSAAHYKGQLLIGGIFDKMLMCEVRAY